MSTQPVLPFGAEEKKRPRLIESLAEVCREFPLDEKVLVSPSYRIGHQIAEALARSGTPWVHLRIESVRGLALAIAGPEIAAEGLTLLSRAQALALVEQACAETLDSSSYFGELAFRPGLHRAIQSTFDELRAAGISPAALPESAFGDPRKVADLKAVLERYESSLARGKFVDRAEVLRRAVDALAKKPRIAGPLYLVAGSFELSAVERELLDLVSGGKVRVLESDAPENWIENGRRTRLFRALGEENEIREIFRRILAEEIPFDDVEILSTDPATYGPLVYELSEEQGIPCTFWDGIAATFTRPAQAVLGYLRWLGRDFESEELHDLLAGGLIDLSRVTPGEEPPGSLPAARELREARIGWGRERNLSCPDAHIARLSAEIEYRRKAEGAEEDRDSRVRWLEKRRATAQFVKNLIARLVSTAPEVSEGIVALPELATAAAAFTSRFAHVSGELDGVAVSALGGFFGELQTLPVPRLPLADAVERLTDAVRALHLEADRPRPGHLHFGDYRSGGFAGRSRTFLVGLDARRHPGSGLQDPVLLDEERRGVNAALRPRELAIRGGRPAENTLALQACLARVHGEVTASYACWNLLEAREQFPATSFLALFRARSGDDAADYSELARALPEPAGFVPHASRALDENEWWLSKVPDHTSSPGSGAEIVRRAYPWLEDGFVAERERGSDRFTLWDGRIRDAAGLDPRTSGTPISCSRIQELARCPYSYFLKRVLRIQPPQEAREDPTIWLDAMETGLLLHEVYRRFYAEAPAGTGKPSLERDAKRLEAIADEEIARWKEDVPPRSAAAFEAVQDDVRVACRILLLRDEEHCRSATPRWFEVPFGPSRQAEVSAPGSTSPVRIALGGGEGFLLAGRIDRVDELGGSEYQVWDYKTGSAWQIGDPARGRGGRRIQDVLYAQAFEVLLARAGMKGRVVGSGYFYAGRRGEGERSLGDLDPAATRATLTALFDLVAEGAFVHSTKKDDCSLCDFQKICGGAESAAERAKAKVDNRDNAVLEPYARLNP
ncbi:MAG TPA: PD-(D/E)XK nuclease family protein [Thermoanaerobaculia bacterium]|nr:PD-(D/E)XK nuclease family protein [Thermoanaerobaculia bacterium]